MGLTLDQFAEKAFDSRFQAELKEYRSANIHRAVVVVRGSGLSFSADDFARLRDDIAANVKISGLKGFGFGLVLNNVEVPASLVEQWVDNASKRGGACQWVVVSHDAARTGCAIHMWQKGSTTPVFEEFVANLTAQGFSLENRARSPEGLMKWAVRLNPLLALQVYKPGK